MMPPPDGRRLRAAGSYVLLSFLELGQGRRSADNRSQVEVLLSMLDRYRTTSLKVFAVALQRRGLRNQELLNVVYEWNLGDIRLLTDKAGHTAASYGVTSGPTTFLIDQGRIVSRWDGFASATELGLTFRDLLDQARATTPIRLWYDDGL
jgi:hypothetical protein